MDKKNDKSQKSNESGKGTGPRRAKEVISQSAERWLARNRSLVLRQTPVWAQSLATIVVSLGISAITAGLLFRIDEVVTVTGQLESLGGSVEVKTPAGGKIASVLFKDGSMIGLNDKLLHQYVEWIANKRMKSIGLKPVYDIPARNNPLPWTQHWISSKGLQVAPQETEVESYIVGGIKQDVKKDTFSGFKL